MIKKILYTLLLGITSSILYTQAQAIESEYTEEFEHVKVTTLLEHEGFLLWYAKLQGWDRELGLDIDLTIINSSGTDVLEAKRNDSSAWDITAIGAVPAFISSENVPIKIIGIANDESNATDILVPNNSDILKTRGWSKEYPYIYGDPDSIRGKNFYLRKGTSSDYTLANWLNIFGLTEDDVNIIDSQTPDIISKVNSKDADGVVLWSPENYEALKNGYQIVSNSAHVAAFVPVVFVSDYDYAEKNPEVLSKFLALYERAARLQIEDVFKLILSYKEFLRVYTGKVYYEDFCIYDLKAHPVFTLEEQISMFTSTDQYNSAMDLLEANIAKRFEKLYSKTMNPFSFFGKSFKRETTRMYLDKSIEYKKNNYMKLN